MLCEQNLWHQIKKGFILLASDDSDEVALAAIGLHGLRELRQLGQVGLGQKLGPLGVVVVQDGVKNVRTLFKQKNKKMEHCYNRMLLTKQKLGFAPRTSNFWELLGLAEA